MNLAAFHLPDRPALQALFAAVLAALLLGFAPDSAQAQTFTGNTSCAAPLKRLQAMASARPHIAEGHAELGRCYLALGRTDIAHESFSRAATLDPTPDRRLEVAIALYHARKLNESAAVLARLANAIPDRANLHFYRGLILLERGEAAEAAARLDHARRLSPGRVEPVASYFAGISYATSGDLPRAKEALSRIALDWEGTQWGVAAQRELNKLGGGPPISYWLEAATGIDYDNNVSLTGRIVTPGEISQKADFQTTHSIRTGAETSGNGWYAGLGAAYQGSIHLDHNAFDVKYPSATIYGYRSIGESSGARLQINFGYGWVGNDPFVWNYDSTFALTHEWAPEYGATEWFVDFVIRDYKRADFDVPGPDVGVNAGICRLQPAGPCGPPDLDEAAKRNRDGIGVRSGFAQKLPVLEPFTEFQLISAYERYNAEGGEYEYDGIEAGLLARFNIDFGLSGEIRSTYRARWFDHPSTYPDYIPPTATIGTDTYYFPYSLSSDKRKENLVEASAKIERELLYDLALSMHVHFEKHFSNTRVYDYSRTYLGARLTWRPDFQ